jgi:hypothetical protein
VRVSMSVLEGVSESVVVLSAFEGPACLRSYLNCSDGDSEYAERSLHDSHSQERGIRHI